MSPIKKLCAFIHFHPFKFSKHVSISALFFIISVMCFVVFAEFLKNNWGFSRIFLPQGRSFALYLGPMGGEFAHSKKFPWVLPGGGGGGWSGLELTDT